MLQTNKVVYQIFADNQHFTVQTIKWILSQREPIEFSGCIKMSKNNYSN